VWVVYRFSSSYKIDCDLPVFLTRLILRHDALIFSQNNLLSEKYVNYALLSTFQTHKVDLK